MVDDFADAQRFVYYGLQGVQTYYPYAGFNDAPFYYETGTERVAAKALGCYGQPDISPFVPTGFYGGAQIWRVMCRGPVPDSLLSAYLPKQVNMRNPVNPRQVVQVPYGVKVVGRVSPSAYFHLTGSGRLVVPRPDPARYSNQAPERS